MNKVFDKALHFFGKTIELDPRAADTYFNIGTVLQQMRKHEVHCPRIPMHILVMDCVAV